ncbi:MAG: division/cell wall cluster transcriptional repressor MraZ [Peptoniphilaceae bacterium]|nr:division/cell wall cluster transcriptional repressor MraZ [Peptoniphilaceae bacterium]MDD7383580.1 division/cell wall cluster transcriptional repressor MraZ [Peptoniphilaceae bacterium]MDY3738752.1 division/cell wall cluster transcriptional repressor MraZ [Peptoniphilaceae bacterium]
MFLGQYIHKLDTKNRIMIPSEFRYKLGDEFFLAKGPENSLTVLTQDEFDKRAQSLNKLDFNSKKNRALKRLFFSSTLKVSLDKQGRLLIPRNLIDYTEIENEAIIIGNNTIFEIWNLDKWNSYIKDVEENMSELMDDNEI